MRFEFVVRQAKKEPDVQKAANFGDFSRRYILILESVTSVHPVVAHCSPTVKPEALDVLLGVNLLQNRV